MNILASFNTPKAPATCAGRVILCELERSTGNEFVTWWQNTLSGLSIWLIAGVTPDNAGALQTSYTRRWALMPPCNVAAPKRALTPRSKPM